MTEDEFEETQWTPAASSAYASMAESALTALADHIALVRGREGRQAELTAYFASGERLRMALDAFREAEFDLCGSFPFAKSGFDDDDEDDDELEDEEDEEPGTWLDVEYQGQFKILDRDGLLAAGRAAYLTAWPDNTEEDARLAVSSPGNAFGELVHVHGMAALDLDVDYLRPSWHQMVAGESDEESLPEELDM